MLQLYLENDQSSERRDWDKLLAIYKRNLQVGQKAIKIATFQIICTQLEEYAKKLDIKAPVLYKILIDAFMKDLADDTFREACMVGFTDIFRKISQIPVYQVVGPMIEANN